jgi:hypothetical protein
MQNPVALYSLEIGAGILFWLVFVVIETAVLQFISWGDFRQCLRASFLANLASGLVIVIAFTLIPRYGLPGLIFGSLLSILIEGLIFNRLKKNSNRLNWIAAILANLVSFFILVLPVYLFSKG